MRGTNFVCGLYIPKYKFESKIDKAPFKNGGFVNHIANPIFAPQNLKLYALFVYIRICK